MSRIALVTGGTRGIGAEISRELVRRGVIVVVNFAHDVEQAQRITATNGIACYRWDVADFDACAEGVARVEAEVGPIDILVNNAGITRDATFAKLTHDMWRQVIDVNLTGCFNMAKAVFGGMRQRGWGRIVSIGSINGQAGQFGQVNYSASKSAIQGLTRSLALEGAAYGITVNMVAPGYIATDMVGAMPEAALDKIVARVPMKRLGTVEEVADAVAYLCSEGARFVTGATLTINGGQYMA